MGIKQEEELKPLAELLFEVSWEVCNKVGGIYTVVKSKVEPMLSFYGSGYFLIGPYFHPKSHQEFQEEVPPDTYKEIFSELAREGIYCRFGTWLTKGNPKVILVDFGNFASSKDSIKKEIWEAFGVDSYATDFFDFDQPVIWGWAVGKLLEKVKQRNPEKHIAAHFHEWLAGSGCLYLKLKNAGVATVFTTHATMLGRTIASADIDLYSILDKINPEEEAAKRNVKAKWGMEKACAQNSTVFTTVSEITGIEAEKILGRKPDILLMNGLDMDRFPSLEEASIRHRMLRNKFKEFVMHYFFPYYKFEIDDTYFFFIAGRYEFHDKGIDLMIGALSMLNEYMKKAFPEKTIVAFFWIPGNVRHIRHDVLENRTYYEDLKESIDEKLPEIRLRLLASLMCGKKLEMKTLFSDELISTIKAKLNRMKSDGVPPLCTHELNEEEKDPIIAGLKKNGLLNRKEDRVKAIFYPIYLTGADRLLDTDYYESMSACHLGIFPSYYEPWGYTPLESAALGVAAVTTDLAGFGRFIMERQDKDNPNKGIFVLRRKDADYEASKKELFGIFRDYVGMDVNKRVENKITAYRLAYLADWKSFARLYIKAHNLGVERMG